MKTILLLLLLVPSIAFATPVLTTEYGTFTTNGVFPSSLFPNMAEINGGNSWTPMTQSTVSSQYGASHSTVSAVPNPTVSSSIMQNMKGLGAGAESFLQYQFYINAPQDAMVPIDFAYTVSAGLERELAFPDSQASQIAFANYQLLILSSKAVGMQDVVLETSGQIQSRTQAYLGTSYYTGSTIEHYNGLRVWNVSQEAAYSNETSLVQNFDMEYTRHILLNIPSNSIQTVLLYTHIEDYQFGSGYAVIDPIITISPSFLGAGYSLLESPLIGNEPNPTAATPEPASMLLMGVGVAGIAFMRRRKMKNAN